MKILIATDSFKDALPAIEVCRAIGKGLQMADPAVDTILFPLGDGGEGTAGVLTYHFEGQMQALLVKDPLFRPVKAAYGLSKDKKLAFIEMAQASGLQLLRPSERNALVTTTYGTGELVLDAIRKGVEKVILCIGGSATNDGGMGMAAALGYRFLDENGETLSPVGENMIRLQRIDDQHLKYDPSRLSVEVVCDVDNPLYGTNGAAYTYAPQKGAGEEAVVLLDRGLKQFGKVLQDSLQKDVAEIKGAGAAGGLGAGAMAFLGARLRRGIDLVMELTGFEAHLEGVDLLITGEGKLDGQTLHGKLIQGITRVAGAHGIPVIAVCGTLEARPEQIKDIGLRAAFSLLTKPFSLEDAIANTEKGLTSLSFNLLRTWDH